MIKKARRPPHLRLVLTELSALSGVEPTVFLDLAPVVETPPPSSVLWGEFKAAFAEGVSVFFSPFLGSQRAFRQKRISHYALQKRGVI